MSQEYKVHLDSPFYGDFSLESLCEPGGSLSSNSSNISSTFQGKNKDPYVLSNDPNNTSANIRPQYWSMVDAYSSFTANTLRDSEGTFSAGSINQTITRVCRCTDTSTVVLTNDKQGSYEDNDDNIQYFYYYYMGENRTGQSSETTIQETGQYRVSAAGRPDWNRVYVKVYLKRFGTSSYTQILSVTNGWYPGNATAWEYVDYTLYKGDVLRWETTGESSRYGHLCIFVRSVTFNDMGITSNGNWSEGPDYTWVKWLDFYSNIFSLTLKLNDSSYFRSSENIKYSNITPILSSYMSSLSNGNYYFSGDLRYRAVGNSSFTSCELAYITKSGNAEGSIYGRIRGQQSTPGQYITINPDTYYEISGSIRLLGIKFTDSNNKEIYRSFLYFKTNTWNNASSDPVHTRLYIADKSNENYLTNFFLEPNGNGEILLCKKGCYPTPVEFCRVTSGSSLTIRTSYYANETSSHDGELSLEIGNQRFFADSFRSGSIPEYIGFLLCGGGGGSGGRATGSADKNNNFGTYPGGGGGGGGITTGVIWLPRDDGNLCRNRNDYYYHLTIGSGGSGGTYSGSASTNGGNGFTGGNTILFETYWNYEDDEEITNLLIVAGGGSGGSGGTDAGNPNGGSGGTVYENSSHEISPLDIVSAAGGRGNNPTTGGSTRVSLSRKFSDSHPYSQKTDLVNRSANTAYSQNAYAGGGPSFGKGGTSSSAAGYGGGGCGIQGGNNSGGGGIAIFYY